MQDERDIPDESDGFIIDSRSGYIAMLDGREVGTSDRQRRAEALLYCAMARACYWPNLWSVNERGNHEQFAFDSHVARHIDNGYV
jgi:hypothetical protein